MRGCGTPRWILAQTWQERGSCGRNYLLKLVKLCQYNSQIHRVPAGRIVTNKQTNKQTNNQSATERPFGHIKLSADFVKCWCHLVVINL
jgi:hypothetical protein